MSSSRKEKDKSGKSHTKDRAAEIANTFEWLITAFVLAFLFRAFVMEAFRIPTGSMADTLKGAHFRLRCRQCGYRYDYGFVPEKYGLPRDSMPAGPLKPYPARCPSCGYYQPVGGATPVAKGDRILVLKCIYQFFKPKQWDVVVFKDPLDPSINYIKRLIGRPEEEVEIIDGDVYINGFISRKPANVQEEVWTIVYDSDFWPVLPSEKAFNNHQWRQPFANIQNSQWQIPKSPPPTFLLESNANQVHTMMYDSSIGNDFRATYAYDDVREYRYMPYCSDLLVRLYAQTEGHEGRVGISTSKYGIVYNAWVDFSGRMVIAQASEQTETVLQSRSVAPPAPGVPVLMKFANVDHQLVFRFGAEEITFDLGRAPNDAGERKTSIEPQVKLFGAGRLTLSHVAVYRDIHYTRKKYANSSETGRATESNPFKLGKDEFFVLGDNSPNSEDSRWWSSRGVGNNGISYRAGVVPRDYLVGKALLVYWPSGFRPFAGFPIAVIPNIGNMRLIYGGSATTP